MSAFAAAAAPRVGDGARERCGGADAAEGGIDAADGADGCGGAGAAAIPPAAMDTSPLPVPLLAAAPPGCSSTSERAAAAAAEPCRLPPLATEVLEGRDMSAEVRPKPASERRGERKRRRCGGSSLRDTCGGAGGVESAQGGWV